VRPTSTNSHVFTTYGIHVAYLIHASIQTTFDIYGHLLPMATNNTSPTSTFGYPPQQSFERRSARRTDL
jgi:hypothetical protein